MQTLLLAWALLAGSLFGSPVAAAEVDQHAPDLSFAEFFVRPTGPRGLEAGPRLLAADGERVRLTGFVVRGEAGGAMMLAPVPVRIDDEDEALADDLPAAVAFLHGDARLAGALAACPAAVRVSGRLDLGARPEPAGRRSFVRLALDDVQCLR